MKKIILLSALSLLASTLSFAGTNSDAPAAGFSIIQNGSIVKVLYKGSKVDNVTVTIFDAGRHKIFAEVLKDTDGFSRPYNLQNLPQSEYVIEVADETGSISHHVVIEDKKVGRTFKITKVHREEGKLLLTVGRYSKGYEMQIEDQYGRTVYEEQQHIDGDFSQVYDISSIKGKFTVTIADENGNTEKFEF